MFRAVHPRSCASGHSIGLNRPLFHRLLHISEQRLSIEVELSLCLRWKDIWRFFIVLRRKSIHSKTRKIQVVRGNENDIQNRKAEGIYPTLP